MNEPADDCNTPATCGVCHKCQRPQPCPLHRRVELICAKCRRPMKGSTAYDGACECGGLITLKPRRER